VAPATILCGFPSAFSVSQYPKARMDEFGGRLQPLDERPDVTCRVGIVVRQPQKVIPRTLREEQVVVRHPADFVPAVMNRSRLSSANRSRRRSTVLSARWRSPTSISRFG
jgi:hypothetical protein